MAGNAKPNSSMKEAPYLYIGGVGSQGAQGSGLFDGTQTTDWNTSRNMYWYGANTYVEFELYQKAALWRSGNASYPGYNAILTIKKFDNDSNSYVDVTNSYVQTVNRIGHTTWDKYIEELEIGRYRFEYRNGLRLDSEWFFEQLIVPYYALKNIQTNELYTIKNNELININSFDYNNIEEDGIKSGTIIDINTIPNFYDTLGFPYEIVAILENPTEPPQIIKVKEHQTRKIVESVNYSLLGVYQLKKLNIVSSGDVFHSFSFDGGVTWKIFDGANWVLNSNINTGMTSIQVNALTSEQLEFVKSDSKTIKIRHSLGNTGVVDQLTLTVDMEGSKQLAPTTSYNLTYDELNKKIIYTIKKAGIYSVNYIDS